MPILQFTADLKLAILAGRKVQTLRRKLPGGCIVGARITMMNGYRVGAAFGHAIVRSFDQVRVSRLTKLDAVLDGFTTLAELHKRLKATDAPPVLWRIRWQDFTPTGGAR